MKRIGIFFSHPTQHHSLFFNRLAEDNRLQVSIYYYDPGSTGGQADLGFGSHVRWGIDLTHPKAGILPNLLRSKVASVRRQLNPAVVPIILAGRFDFVLLFGYVSLSNWLVFLTAKLIATKLLYQSDVNVLNERRKYRSGLHSYVRRAYLRGMDHILYIGNKNKEFYLEEGVPEAKLSFGPYPVDCRRFADARREIGTSERLRQHYGIHEQQRVFVFCGKLIRRKRPADFVQAVLRLDPRKAFGLMIGSGPLQNEIEAMIPRDAPIKLTGFVDQQMMPEYLLLGHVGVVCSEYDAHPIVCTEMAACGMPLIVSHYCGVYGPEDILREQENGYVYECGNISALSEKMEFFISDPELWSNFSERSKQLAKTQSIEAAASALEAFLAHVAR